MIRVLIALNVVLLTSVPIQAQVVFTDDFNRPDDVTLGPNWQVIGTGSATRVISNQAGNIAASNNLSLVTPANFSDVYTNTMVTADVFKTNTGLGYAALAFGHNGSSVAGQGLFIKIQDSGGVMDFDNIGFYTGINGSTQTFWTDPPIFFAAIAPFVSARMTVWASDTTTINLGLDTDFNGSFDQTYSRHINLATITLGTQAGLGVFGNNVRVDDYMISAVPEPGSLILVGCGLIAGCRFLRRRPDKG
jgi:hypothetical protein